MIEGHELEVVVAEERTRVPHHLTPAEQARPAESRWAPRWDYVASGRLVLRLGHDYYGPPLATDRTRWRIEDRLGRAFERLEAAAADAEARRQERLRAENERHAHLEEGRWMDNGWGSHNAATSPPAAAAFGHCPSSGGGRQR